MEEVIVASLALGPPAHPRHSSSVGSDRGGSDLMSPGRALSHSSSCFTHVWLYQLLLDARILRLFKD